MLRSTSRCAFHHCCEAERAGYDDDGEIGIVVISRTLVAVLDTHVSGCLCCANFKILSGLV